MGEGFDFSVVEDHIALVTLNRTEKLNAMTQQFFADIGKIFRQIKEDKSIRVVVLSANGRIFSAGLDLIDAAGMLNPTGADPARNALAADPMIEDLQKSFLEIENCGKPVVAVAHSKCVGGAVDLLCSCDIRYCTADAQITVKEVDIGMCPDLGTAQRMGKICGNEGWVRELHYTGRYAAADECFDRGFFGKIFPDKDAAIAGAMDLARTIANKSPVATYAIKQILNYSRDHTVEESLTFTRMWNNAALQTADMAIAIQANIGKTTPTFPKL